MSGLHREVTMTIAAAPEKVWDLVSDVTRIGEFSPETFEARWTRGATGPAVGATFKGHVKRNGVGPTYWSPCTVTKCVAPGADGTGVFEFSVGLDGSAWTNWGYRLAPEGPDGAATRVTEYFRLEPKWFLRGYWLVLGALRGRTNERGMRTTLERMKEVLEA
ncbi:SRPBCC family protein [Nocardioides humilatus]|nr:SRPBCC family protein [Nocardioides humilatus]